MPDIRPELYQTLMIECRGLCAICHEHSAQQIHHIEFRSEGGSNDYDNLIPLCSTCHSLIHTRGHTPEELRSIRRSWVATNQTVLAEIIDSDDAPFLLTKKLSNNFLALREVGEFGLFKGRLRSLLRKGEVFNNFARVLQHDVVKTVDEDANCQTSEAMTFRPIRMATYRTVHLRGDGPMIVDRMNLSASLKINGRSSPFVFSVLHDEPSYKVFKYDWKRTASDRDVIDLKFDYYWEKTWNLDKDYYSYDVLSWADKMRYRFSLPGRWRHGTVGASFIDLYGNEWPTIGTTEVRGNSFEWKGTRLLIFSTIVIKYEAQELNGRTDR